MAFLDKLRQVFSGGGDSKSSHASSPTGDPDGIMFYFRCNKCGSPVKVRVDRRSDLNPEDGPAYYVVRKDVMDSKCFQLMKAEIWLDTSYTVVQSDVRGGELISEADYKAALKPSA